MSRLLPPMAVVMIALSTFAVGTARADEVADAVAGFPANVDELRVVGAWGVGDFRGTYRLLVARSGPPPVKARLFVQWVALEVGGNVKVESSVEVEELAALDADIGAIRTKAERDGLLVFIDTIGGDPGSPHNYELALGPPDQYRFGPFTN
ncbi:MAG: hypothetical protein U1E56_05695 [Bauldia sp.]